MKYRADIDGLRAVAVLAVVGFHAGVPWLTGGFAGVDVFFVISGFLIAGVVAERQANGDFSLGWFWERRVRRIFPSLMVVLAVTTALSAWLLLPGDFVQYAQSMGAALLSLSNVFFWKHQRLFRRRGPDPAAAAHLVAGGRGAVLSGLPAADAADRPVRGRPGPHGARRPGGGLAGLRRLADRPAHAEAAFYLPFARAWELLAGVLLALWKPAIPPPGAAARRPASPAWP
jgi:peptidoglycan/LPS O-acetylase OafA/YrhL